MVTMLLWERRFRSLQPTLSSNTLLRFACALYHAHGEKSLSFELIVSKFA